MLAKLKRSSPSSKQSKGHAHPKPWPFATGRPRACFVWGALLVGFVFLSTLLVFSFLGQDAVLLRRLLLRNTRAARPNQDLPLPHKAQRYAAYDCGLGSIQGGGCNAADLLILQTSDGRPTSTYARMLDALQGVHLAYAAQWGFHYMRWDGLAKGRQAWHATYNRIYLLDDLYKRGRYHWVLWLDPDAIIRDPRLSVTDLLDERYAVVGCRGGDNPTLFYDINIGVAFFNLRHPDFGDLIRGWVAAIDQVADSQLNRGSTENYVAMRGGARVPDDQQMLHTVLERHPRGRRMVKRFFGDESGDTYLFNYKEGKYVAHLIREDNPDQDLRFLDLLQLKASFFEALAAMENERLEAAQRAYERNQKEATARREQEQHVPPAP